jgi:hypothetical protein
VAIFGVEREKDLSPKIHHQPVDFLIINCQTSRNKTNIKEKDKYFFISFVKEKLFPLTKINQAKVGI